MKSFLASFSSAAEKVYSISFCAPSCCGGTVGLLCSSFLFILLVKKHPCLFRNGSCGSFMMKQWRIGCSGYHYPEWKGLFYPERLAKNRWFDFYCQHFNTIEL